MDNKGRRVMNRKSYTELIKNVLVTSEDEYNSNGVTPQNGTWWATNRHQGYINGLKDALRLYEAYILNGDLDLTVIEGAGEVV